MARRSAVYEDQLPVPCGRASQVHVEEALVVVHRTHVLRGWLRVDAGGPAAESFEGDAAAKTPDIILRPRWLHGSRSQ